MNAVALPSVRAKQASYASQVLDVMSRYASQGTNLCLAAMAGAKTCVEWRHYPNHDAQDPLNQTEFYYHAHSADDRLSNEHGHFHVFVRGRRGRVFHHLVGISLDSRGMPIRLFLTNRWVTGETWVDAATLQPALKRFRCAVSGRLAPVSRWITAVVHLYRDEIVALHRRRDQWCSSRLGKMKALDRVLENRRDQVVAQLKIDLMKRLASSV